MIPNTDGLHEIFRKEISYLKFLLKFLLKF